MDKLHFATINRGKLKEASDILNRRIIGIPGDIEEIQSMNLEKVASQKATGYYQVLKKPLFVEDVALSFSALKGLPGAYINDFSKVLGNDGLVELLKNKKDREAVASVVVAYIPKAGRIYKFNGEVKGTIVKKPRGDKGFGWDAIFIPNGEKRTFAEMTLRQKNKYSMRKKALVKFGNWLDRHEK